MNKQLVKKQAPAQAIARPITIKQVMILDTGDGAYTDESVKTKPYKGDDRKLMLKCTDAGRLLATVKRLGLVACSPVLKGKKHYMVAVWKNQFGSAISAQSLRAHQAPKMLKKGA